VPKTPPEPTAAPKDQGGGNEAARVEQLKDEISGRLRRVCSHLTAEQFAALVDDIARVTLRYETPENKPRRAPRGD
jgi:hypothetical protein